MELARFEPGVNLKLTVGEMLEGAHFNMDTFTMGDAKNYATGDNIKEQAVARHTGMSIDVPLTVFRVSGSILPRRAGSTHKKKGKSLIVRCVNKASGFVFPTLCRLKGKDVLRMGHSYDLSGHGQFS